ncbi:unnamed protein product [Dovyalis caffra]|uniref:Dirigent protein n=1 Tax=Dovyalis caffra TaxID=77055 RepID=A0AAV1SS72_9ROSI|nr:unnamed protein product [Dovyalis caffra]
MAMAQSVKLFILINLLFALSFKAISTSNYHFYGLKSLRFTLYQHETLNKTAYLIVNGVTGQGITPTTSPFGSLFAYQDNLTITSNPSSKVVGISEAISITSTLDGLGNIAISKTTLEYKRLKGSISIVGSAHSIEPSDLPIVGGTGDFTFVQGYMTSTPVNISGFAVTYKFEFHLYWPPYANPSSLHN